MTIWFTSDQHFGHRNIIKYCNRPFVSVEDMNDALVAKFNAVVKPRDLVYHLGDFSMNERWVEPMLRRLHGKHSLICGNHDRCHPSRKRRVPADVYLRYGFEIVVERAFVEGFLLCHLPYTTVRDDLRYDAWRPINAGDWLLHGHVHEAWRVRGRQINVGVDVWDYGPIHLDELITIRSEGQQHE